MSFIVETPPVLRHKCKLPKEYYIDKDEELAQPTYAHLTIWQCDECKKYYMYQDRRGVSLYPFCNEWKLISEKKAIKLVAIKLRYY